MISKLPRWVWTGAGALAFVAGMVNVVGVLGFNHQAVTHLTGTTSMLGGALAAGDRSAALHFFAVIAAFVTGTAMSGFLIQNTALQLGRRYGVALLLESILLCLAVSLLRRHNPGGDYLASCACGLQNAMASTYSGSLIRTTHLSGTFTDLGIFLGHALRGIPVDRRRMRLCFIIVSSFLSGGIAGGLAFRHFDYGTLYIPAALTGSAALGYGLYQLRKNRVAQLSVE